MTLSSLPPQQEFIGSHIFNMILCTEQSHIKVIIYVVVHQNLSNNTEMRGE